MPVPVGLNVWSRLVEDTFPYLDQTVAPFESLWFPDHVQYGAHKVAEGWTLLAFALARYPDKMCTHEVLCNSFRNPAHLAKMVATAHALSGGRVVLGIGAGWNEEESGAYGLELGSPRERSDRFEEACQVLIGLLSQPTTTFSGTYYQLTNAYCEPKGVQQPHPPICIGGAGEKRTLRTTALYAQHWNFVGGALEEFTRKRDVLYAHCEDVGRDPKEITLSSHIRMHEDSAEEIQRITSDIAALSQEGLDLAIIILPTPHSPAILAPLAEALAPLR
jgi:alkanesulfonate monooxygenase SsuD/methylene tetrahydromethanopterin reductase-like flavin-dependent oxidoreductase (luciferase family)